MKPVFLIALLLIFPLLAAGQNNRYFVSFKDKGNTPYSISEPLKFLSQKSIDRRVREGFGSDTGYPALIEDLPVDPAYVHQVRDIGAAVFFTSRWFNGVLIQADAGTATAVGGLSFVSRVEMVAPGNRLTPGRIASRSKNEQIQKVTTLENQLQLHMIGLDEYHTEGYNGEGIDIAILDDGFISVNSFLGFKPLFQEGRVKSVFNFVNNTEDVYEADNHGTATLSILAGNLPGIFLGGAYKANFFLFQTEDASSEYRIEEYNWTFAAERADSAGVDVISSSLGYNYFDDPSMNYTYESMDGKTSVISRAARKAFLRGISVVNAAGNEGGNEWQYVVAPADAEGVIACGAVDFTIAKANFSSIGPTADGRVKPDVCALGVSTTLFGTDGCCFKGNGTSFSCPLIAGLVACMRQKYPSASANVIYNKLIQSASQFNNPDNSLGYGIPNLKGVTEEPVIADEFELYPNPVIGDTLKIIFKESKGQTATVSIYNSSGQKVNDFSGTITSSNNPLLFDFSPYVSGLYYVKTETVLLTKTERVLKR